MRRFELTDEQWEKIKHLLPAKEGDSGRMAKDSQAVVEMIKAQGGTPVIPSKGNRQASTSA